MRGHGAIQAFARMQLASASNQSRRALEFSHYFSENLTRSFSIKVPRLGFLLRGAIDGARDRCIFLQG
jgi:hypothetical protein